VSVLPLERSLGLGNLVFVVATVAAAFVLAGMGWHLWVKASRARLERSGFPGPTH
jgi:uncharacterized iron-regulated membrane protein